MATRAELHRLVDELPDPEVPRARIVIEDPPAEEEHESGSHGTLDDWGDLGATTHAAAAETMRGLEEEERAAGHQPWRP
jgi:hypothetical protein